MGASQFLDWLSKLSEKDAFKKQKEEIAKNAFEDAKESGKSDREALQTVAEVKEFLEKPEVKEKVVQLKTAEKKLAQVTQKIAQLEMQDPTLKARVDGMPTPSGSLSSPSASSSTTMTTAPEVSTSAGDGMLRLFEYTRAREERNTLVKSVLDAGVSVKKSMDAYASSHSWPDKLKHGVTAAVQGVGYGLTAGAIVGAAYEGGFLAALATGGSILATGEAFAAVAEHGAEHLVDYAISQADTQEQAHDYADVAMSLVEAGATGLAAFGAFRAVR